MKMRRFSVLLISLLYAAVDWGAASDYGDSFTEELFLKPLSDDHVYAYFQFVTLWPANSSLHHTRLFPRSLGEIIARHGIEELHLSLSEGLWRHDKWGYPVADAPPGAELYARFSPLENEGRDGGVDERWRRLAETLSGLFCASLNFVDESDSLSPQFSFGPSGVRKGATGADRSYIRYATLPREIVCTENLTPWKKLLPCDSKRGLATLLNSGRLHDTGFHSLGVHFRSACADDAYAARAYELKQTVSLVYDPAVVGGGGVAARDWSVQRLFGQGLFGACPLAAESLVYVDVTSSSGAAEFALTPEPDFAEHFSRGGVATKLAGYDLKKARRNAAMNVAATYPAGRKLVATVPPPIHAHRYIAGYGQERSAVVTRIHNNHWQPLDVVLMENIPWFLPVYLHTLKIRTGDGRTLLPRAKRFVPGKGKTRPYQLELALRLPPKSVTRVSIEFDFVFLKWQEYPPDANHGFYVGSAVLTASLPLPKNFTGSLAYFGTLRSSMNVSRQNYIVQLHTESMIITLPTPDFSMPYNVICLACTVVALAFGPLYNITTKSLQLKPDKDKKKNLLQKIKSKLFIWKSDDDSDDAKEVSAPEKDK